MEPTNNTIDRNVKVVTDLYLVPVNGHDYSKEASPARCTLMSGLLISLLRFSARTSESVGLVKLYNQSNFPFLRWNMYEYTHYGRKGWGFSLIFWQTKR